MKNSFLTGSVFWFIAGILFLNSGCKENKTCISRIYIETDTSKINEEKKTPCSVTYLPEGNNKELKAVAAQIRHKGNQSLAFEKKSFSLEFDENVSLEGMEKDDDWKINASYIDKTFLRNKISYDLFRLFSEGNIAPHVSWSEVYLNNNYHGLFIITDRIDSKTLKLDKKDTSAVVFKSAPISNPPANHEKIHQEFANYLMVADRWKSWSKKGRDELAEDIYFNQRYPDYPVKDKHFVIYEITDFLFNSTNEKFTGKRNGIDSLFDLENIIDFHLLLLVTNNSDGLTSNNYLYRQNTNSPYRICPYDFDHSFGRDGDGELNPDGFLECNRNYLLKKLVETNAFNYNVRLKEKYLKLKKENIISEQNIVNMIAENAERLRPFVLKNEVRWPLADHHYFLNTGFDNEVEIMKNSVGKQLKRVEKYLDEL